MANQIVVYGRVYTLDICIYIRIYDSDATMSVLAVSIFQPFCVCRASNEPAKTTVAPRVLQCDK